MSQGPYATWPTGVKAEHDQYPGLPQVNMTSGGYSQVRHAINVSRSGMRPHSSSTSSLSGAMGDAQLGVSRNSATPPSGLASWTPSPTSSSMAGGPFVAEDPNLSFIGPVTPVSSAGSSTAFAAYDQYGIPLYGSPEASPGLVSSFPEQYGYPSSQGQLSSAAMMISPSSTPAPGPSSRHSRTSPEKLEEENRRLLERIRQLEIVNHSSSLRIRQLEAEVSRGVYPGGLPSPMTTPQPAPSFEQEWRARTEARKKLFCSLNRAGNALCSWHDSRRERRVYPPRNAPPGYLNCGCTYEEALFEESLARHGVGSYLPGENVRMDPALRNPLLKLLQKRYGYRDGDFERDPVTGSWIGDEGAAKWEQRLASGAPHSRRNRTDADRRST
ncbi:hypothetical protein ONZ51_g3306 [Trametes cubensis]|uniref:Uncharacterized protein n=1 Tax=Trametes cubensis TaxID=1111947 RepID=A0AAD7TYH2_9APHY|nr:hypothetical protein ONZ51_g3306 [Trametes cubensis]